MYAGVFSAGRQDWFLFRHKFDAGEANALAFAASVHETLVICIEMSGTNGWLFEQIDTNILVMLIR
jgi:hypothetical protein